MRSRRANQIAIGVLVLIVVAFVIGLRFILLGFFDNNIADEESTIRSTQTSINEVARLVDLHGQQTLPSMVEMHRFVPSQYNQAQLDTFVRSQLEISGISNVTDRNRRVSISETNALAIDPDLTGVVAYRIHVSFRTTSEQEIFNFVNRMLELDQFFILQSISYNMPSEDAPAMVTINFVTFYKKS